MRERVSTHWYRSHRADDLARPLADRHYNRQKIGAKQFVPPGRCLVLLARDFDALWITSWPFAEYVKHAWAGAWVNSLFRNESPILSSDLIREAVMATAAYWGEVPPLGMVSFIDAKHVRRKRDYGRCYVKAGWQRPMVDGEPARTKGGLYVVQAAADRILDGT